MTVLHTIGYQGATLGGFIAALQDAGVSVLVDVRAVPWSRRREFVKKALAESLEQAGISYVHLPALGNPEQGREAAKARRPQDFRRIYESHLQDASAYPALSEAEQLAASGGACLMCMESDAQNCHRSLLAVALSARTSFTVRHLTVPSNPNQPDLFSRS